MQMCTYIIFFPTELLSNFVWVVQKRLGMNKFVRTKSPRGSKFSKIFFEQLYTGWTVVVHQYCGFLCGVRWQIQNRVFGQFRTSLRKDSVDNYALIRTLFSTSVTGRDVLCNALNSSQIRLQMAPQGSQNCGRNFAKRKQSDADFAPNTTYG